MSLFSRRMLVILLVGVLLSVAIAAGSVTDVWAQTGDAPVGLDELKEEREQAAREAALAAQDIDVFNASVEEVTKALDQIAAFVEIQEIRLAEAEARYRTARNQVGAAEQDREAILATADALRSHLSELAVSSFTGETGSAGDEVTDLILSDDPGESARLIHLLELQTGSIADGIDQLRGLEFEAEELIVVQETASLVAAESLAEVEARTAELQAALDQQELVVASAELRLEAQLAEAAFLAERDLELANAIRSEQTAINNRLTATARAQGIDLPDPVDLNDIVLVSFFRDEDLPEPTVDPETGEVIEAAIPLEAEAFYQIEVHRDIEEQTRRLFELAFEQGIDLGGWGYRPIQRQVELRAAHCGGSDFDIWQRSAFECSPPTARPGFSKHEQGRAIDFQWNGAGITSQNTAAFQWLQSNAPQFGFVNLPSEPWHWSIDEGAERLAG